MGSEKIFVIALLTFCCASLTASGKEVEGYQASNGVVIKWNTPYGKAQSILKKLIDPSGTSKKGERIDITDNKTFPGQSNDSGGTWLKFDGKGFVSVSFSNLKSLSKTKERLEQIYGRPPDKELNKKNGEDETTLYFWFGEKSNAVLAFQFIQSVSMTITMVTISKEKECPLKDGCGF